MVLHCYRSRRDCTTSSSRVAQVLILLTITDKQQCNDNSYTQASQAQPIQDTNNLHYALCLGIGSGHHQLIAVTCIAEHAYAATYTNAHALAKPQAGPCPMSSAEGKRVGRVLAGCSKPEAGDKPGLHTWQVILGTRSLHRSAR